MVSTARYYWTCCLPASLTEHVALQSRAWTVALSQSTAGTQQAGTSQQLSGYCIVQQVHTPAVHVAKHLHSLSCAFLLVLHMKLHGLLKGHVTKCWWKGICCHHHSTLHVTHCKSKDRLKSEELCMTAVVQETVSAACLAGALC